MFLINLLVLALALAACRHVSAATAAEWRSRSIYQVMTDRFARSDGSITAPCDTTPGLYCGGSWQGVINHLDYIQGMGFDAVWISPVTAQLMGPTPDGESYHGYWQQDLYAVNPSFGTESDLQSLSAALHDRGMYLMVDVVTNHFAWNGTPSSIVYQDFNPFNSQSYFHPFCEINYSNIYNTTEIEDCWEGDTYVPLPDLRTEDSDVQQMFNSWIASLVSTYSIDGLRIDSVMQVNTGFWASFLSAAGVYAVGEIDNADVSYVCSFQDYVPGVLNYGTYFPLLNAFTSTSGNISGLVDAINTVKCDCADTSLLGTFSENQDQPRFASYTGDWALAKNIITFTMLTDGIPIIYEGQEQHYASLGGFGVPFNREAIWLSGYNTSAELYLFVQTLNTIRKNAMATDATFLSYQNWPIYSTANAIAMRKGQLVTVLSNYGQAAPASTLTFASGYAADTQVTELLTCATLMADGAGNLAVPMDAGLPRIYYPTANLSSSGLCGSSSKFKPRQASKFWAPMDRKL